MAAAILLLPCFGKYNDWGAKARAVPAFAASDPLAVVNNMSDFVFSIIMALDVILLGFGIVQIGMSLKSHDASQRAIGFMTFFGGLLIAFAKEILNLIMA